MKSEEKKVIGCDNGNSMVFIESIKFIYIKLICLRSKLPSDTPSWREARTLSAKWKTTLRQKSITDLELRLNSKLKSWTEVSRKNPSPGMKPSLPHSNPDVEHKSSSLLWMRTWKPTISAAEAGSDLIHAESSTTAPPKTTTSESMVTKEKMKVVSTLPLALYDWSSYHIHLNTKYHLLKTRYHSYVFLFEQIYSFEVDVWFSNLWLGLVVMVVPFDQAERYQVICFIQNLYPS